MEDDNFYKKFKSEFKSSISFWSDTNRDNFENEIPIAESELSFTSAEINQPIQCIKTRNIKFIVRDIIKIDGVVKLYGDDVICLVKGEWSEIKFETNTKITVMPCLCCDKEMHNEFKDGYIYVEVDDENNYLFIEDDLMTITNLVSSIRCINNPLINSKVADINFNFNDKCLVNGIILHDVMESCILNQDFRLSYIMSSIQVSMKNNIMNIYCCNTTEKIVKEDIMKVINNIIAFNKQNIIFDECEKQIASLTMNLKGNVDAVSINNTNKNGFDQGVVLEIKSGKSLDISHKAQVLLYSMLLNEKYKKQFVPYLFYITANDFIKVDIKHSEAKSLMILRNKLTLLKDIEQCHCCEYDTCKIIKKICNMSDTHWLKRMWVAIEKEEKFRQKETWHLVKFKKQVDLIVVFTYDNFVIDELYINIYTLDLVKICKGVIDKYDNMFIHVSLSEKINLEKNSDYYISLGNNDIFFKFMRYSLINIAYFRYLHDNNKNGFHLPEDDFFEDLNSDSIETTEINDILFDEDSSKFLDGNTNINVVNKNLIIVKTDNVENNKIVIDRIDSVETRNIINSYDKVEHKNNYITNDIVIDKNVNNVNDINTFSSSSFVYFTPEQPELKRFKYQIPELYMSQFLKLNENQKAALFSALNCENYKIIHGMPGTGKSTVIVLLIKILIYLNKKVLLVCYTNLAITNILSKLKTIRSYRARKETCNFSSVTNVKSFFKNVDLVASTCFGFRDPIFLERSFDYCILDEGSQQHLLLTLIPVSLSSKFVIFGDHLQLKPLSKASPDLSTSLFEYLLDKDHSELSIQYRMGLNIMNLSNELFYNGKLKLGKEREDSVTFIDSSTINYPMFMSDVKNTVILCYFNSQVKKTQEYTKCQVETVDRFQGSESDNIIVVFDPVVKCDVLESKERLNVALTRAKNNLILIGDLNKMKDIDILHSLLEIMNIIL